MGTCQRSQHYESANSTDLDVTIQWVNRVIRIEGAIVQLVDLNMPERPDFNLGISLFSKNSPCMRRNSTSEPASTPCSYGLFAPRKQNVSR